MFESCHNILSNVHTNVLRMLGRDSNIREKVMGGTRATLSGASHPFLSFAMNCPQDPQYNWIDGDLHQIKVNASNHRVSHDESYWLRIWFGDDASRISLFCMFQTWVVNTKTERTLMWRGISLRDQRIVSSLAINSCMWHILKTCILLSSSLRCIIFIF